ncbi:MAG: helix-turn-helix transcriptional regulator [Polyangiales bacterium]
MVSVLLLSDRPEFAESWGAVCRAAGLTVQTHGGEGDFALALEAGSGLVIDGATGSLDASSVIGRAAAARVKGAIPLVALPPHERHSPLEDLLLALCGGLVATSEDEMAPLVRTLRRRCERPTSPRFAYVGIAPDQTTLLAVLGDGLVCVVERPLGRSDEGARVARVELLAEGRSARVWLEGDESFEVAAVDTLPGGPPAPGTVSSIPPPPAGNASGFGDIDGVRLGQRLRALRLAAGLTQAELARRTGIHRPNIARVEAGRHTPSLETLARLAAAIGVSTTRVLAD